jgi:hypothetical protein
MDSMHKQHVIFFHHLSLLQYRLSIKIFVLQIMIKTSSPNSLLANVSSISSRDNNHNNPAAVRRPMKEVEKISLIDLAGSEQ